jgi:hypothetical protein
MTKIGPNPNNPNQPHFFYLLLVIGFLLALQGCSRTQPMGLPSPPSGYSWQELKTVKSAILLPNGWYFDERTDGQTLGFFVTKEELAKHGNFETGFTVNVMKNVQEKKGLPPSAFIAAWTQEAAAKFPLTNRTASADNQKYRATFQFVDNSPGKESTSMHHTLFGNDPTGTVFVIIYETPTRNLDAEWPIASTVLRSLMLDDEV